MRIGIDLAPAMLQPDGIGRFALGLASGLGRVDRETTYVLCCNFFRGFDRERARRVLPAGPNLVPVVRRVPARAMHWTGRLLPAVVERMIGKLDLFHLTDFTLSPMERVPTLITIHDLGYEVNPGWYPGDTADRIRRMVMRQLDRGAQVLTVSEGGRREVIRRYRLPEDRVHAALLGVDHDRFGGVGPEGVRRVRARYRLGEAAYLLHVGTIQPRKNIDRLLEGFRIARARGLDEILVLVGKAGWLCDGTLAEIAELEREGAARYLGYVPDEDLPALYRSAAAGLYVSHYEGFGLPVLEAMAAGRAVVVSAAGGLLEVAGEAGLRVDPGSAEEMAEAMLRVSRDLEVRAGLEAASLRRAARFTWEACARDVRAAYAAMLGGEGGTP